jgi:hypothetical protein
MKSSKKITACILILAMALAGCVTNNSGTVSIEPACAKTGGLSASFTNTWLSWQSICILAAFTVFLVSILAFVLGYAIQHQKAIAWAKEQMQEAVLAMIITLFVIGFVSFLCGLDIKSLGLVSSCGGASEPSCNMIEAASGYLSEMYKTIMSGYFLVIAMNSVMTSMATVTIGFAPAGVGATFAPFAFLNDIANSLLIAMIALITSAIIVLTQIILLKMTASIFTILFPIGIILRSFGATRGFGGGLIAIALGFFIFYPFLVVLFYGATIGDIQSDYSNLGDSFKTAGPSPSSSDWFLGGGLLNYLVGFVGKTIMGAIFIPLIMFMILIAFVKGLSTALGEEVDVSNLTRLI